MLYQSTNGQLIWKNYTFNTDTGIVITNWIARDKPMQCTSHPNDGRPKCEPPIMSVHQANLVKALTRRLRVFLSTTQSQPNYSTDLEHVLEHASKKDHALQHMIRNRVDHNLFQILPDVICSQLFEFWKTEFPEKNYDSDEIYEKCEGILGEVLEKNDERCVIYYKGYDHHNTPYSTTTLELINNEWIITENINHYEHTKYNSKPGFTII